LAPPVSRLEPRFEFLSILGGFIGGTESGLGLSNEASPLSKVHARIRKERD
jgi:hypothetical protein